MISRRLCSTTFLSQFPVRRFSHFKITPPADPRPSPPDAKAHHPKPGEKTFSNPWPSFQSGNSLWKFLKGRLSGEYKHKPTPPDVEEQVGRLPPSWQTGDKSKIKAVWLGHACFYVELPCHESQTRGIRILFDPNFSERCSPFSFMGPKRYTKTPTTVEELPEIDLVCISHNHYDHLDLATVQKLHKRFGDSIQFLAPLKVSSWFNSCGITNVTEFDWWEEKLISKGDLEARVGYLPAQHFSGRGLNDRFHTLWGSFSLESTSHPEKKIWFAADTARRSISKEFEMGLPETQAEIDKLPVCPAHRQIGELRGPFSFAMIPVGAYLPRCFMSPVHIDVIEALEVFKEVRADYAVGMHWGTFNLSGEDVLEPRDELKRLCQEKGVKNFVTWKLGERREI